MASGNAKSENLEAPLFSVSATPAITSHKLNATNYSAWSASVKFWFLSQGHYDHLEKSLDDISEEKHDNWIKLDYQLCALLWQSVDSNILPNFKAFKTCHSFWKKAHSVFAYDNKLVYDSAQKLVALKQCDNDMLSYVSKAQSVVEEFKLYLKSDTLEEMNNKLDNLFMMLVLHGMHSDFKHVCDEILSSQELPSLEKLFIHLLQVPSQKIDGNSTSCNAIGQGNCREPGGGEGFPDVSSGQEYVHNSQERLTNEQEEKEDKKKQEAEAHLYIIIKVARDEDLTEQIGKDIYFDLVDHDKVKSFRVPKQTSFNHFKDDVAKEFGIPVQFQRFWLWTKRQNHTYRPHRPLTHLEEAKSVGQLREASNNVHNAELKLFLEVELGLDLRPIAPPDKIKDNILLFFKMYDPEKEELRYVGRLYVEITGKVSKILSRLNEMAGYESYEEIRLYEEIMFEPYVMCVPINKNVTFRESQLQDGDIICFQKISLIERTPVPVIQLCHHT